MSQERFEELRALVGERRYVQIVRVADALIAEGALSPSEEAEAHHMCSAALYRQEQVFPALERARLAERLAEELHLTDLAQRVRVNLTALYVDFGDTRLAIETGEKVLSDERLAPSVRQQLAYVHYNVARAHQARHDKRASFEHFRTAVRLGKECGVPDSFMVQMRQLFAWRLYLDEQIAEADRHVEEAGALIEEDDAEGQREQLLLSCLRAHQVGDMARVVELAEEFVATGAPATDRQRAWAYLLLGWASVDLDSLDDAATFADEVLERAIALNAPELMNHGNRLRHRVNGKREAAG